MEISQIDQKGLKAAISAAQTGISEGGMPFGAALVNSRGDILATGHNRQIQSKRWLAHAETECLESFLTSLEKRASLADVTLYATEAPCPMCAGAALVAGIGRCVVGEAHHYTGALELLRAAEVEVLVLDDKDCIDMVTDFRRDHAERWNQLSAG
ncbi:MAG: nucleoside deaminase [Actinomycetaceae bacterium]|nr:nucleoside deaminase [Actinomycetaceae bacterium]